MNAIPTSTETVPRSFPYERWSRELGELSQKYAENKPFKHIALNDFLDEDIARRVVAEFPGPSETSWTQYKHYNENKLGQPHRDKFPPTIRRLFEEFLTPEFVSWLSELVGIEGLLPDPDLEGGGMHQTERGGFLNIHADFTMHPHKSHWRRRVNLILYLNEGWEDDWGGALEFWDRDMQNCVTKVPPLFNHAAIFSTDEHSYHGYPDHLTCPPDRNRKSLALYYFTEEETPQQPPQWTDYRARPGDGMRGAFIWLDKKMVALYSRIKRRFNLSDDFASRVLGFFSRKK